MSEREGLRFEGTMTHIEFLSKFKRFNPLEPSLAILGFFFATLLFVACFFYSDFRGSLGLRSRGVWWLRVDGSSSASYSTHQRPDFLDQASDGCDVFDGNWVWDESYPLYQSTECDFLDEGFRCTENGRTDSFFTHWRWQPKDCNLPRFDAITMLEKLRNQRVVFAGDSIGRNQWESLLCMLSSAIPNKTSIYEVNGRPITKHTGFLVYKFEDFNCTLEYYRAPFLVLQSRAPAGSPENVKLTVKLDQMDWSSSRWKGADVLILNTGHWWNVEKTTNVGCYFQEGNNVSTEMSVENAYRRSMETVVDFLGTQVNMTKTRVFFRTYAPIHFIGGDWKTGGTCHLEKLPDLGSLPDSSSDPHFKIALDVLSEHANEPHVKRLDVLNVTGMSSRRKDGHASIYYLGPEVGPASVHRQDCSHWCLPGVPDSWNELMYAVFMKREYEYASAQNSTNSTRPM